ncbi:uncharacterized protein [Linepithema humile]|uniref:uncharacterized protein n=1 Tax=Linepithema humile TaxID=83485 RepID=UPI00351EF12F
MSIMQDEVKRLKRKRTTIKSQCTRAHSYIEGRDAQRATIIELRVRLQKLHTAWDEFNQVQSEIEAFEEEAEVPIESDERPTFEEKYFTVTSAFETLIEEKLAEARPLLTEQNYQRREGTPRTNGTSLKLPRVSLLMFSGKYEEWIAYRNMFHSMIEQNTVLPDVQKMQYLLSSLKGEAFDVISSLEASAENYREAWQMLKDRYDDPGLIVGKHVKALFELP